MRAAPMLAAALKVAARGWPVFPCKPRSKEPATEHGFLDASSDPDVIRHWWSRTPAANLAIPTGAPAIDVLDVDIKGLANGMIALGQLETAGLLGGSLGRVRTPSGGLHYYYRGTQQTNGSLRRHGVDFRGRGGYVLVPPSYVVDTVKGYQGYYELLDWRTGARGQALNWQQCKELLEPPRPKEDYTGRPGDITGLARWMARQPEGGRNNCLFWAACKAVEEGQRANLHLLVDAAIAAGLPEFEARRTAESAARRVGAA